MTFVHLFEFVEIFFSLPLASLARCRACPDLVAAPTSPGLPIRAVSRGSPFPQSLTLQYRES